MLSPRAWVVLDTMLPREAHPQLPWGIFETGFNKFYEEFQRTAVLPLRLGFRCALFAAIWIAPLLIWRVPPITRHDRETRERALQALYLSRWYVLRQVILLLKAMIAFCYGAHPAVREAVGYPRQFDCSGAMAEKETAP